jgi:hypothetical protein
MDGPKIRLAKTSEEEIPNIVPASSDNKIGNVHTIIAECLVKVPGLADMLKGCQEKLP